jgi:hypothetical protein
MPWVRATVRTIWSTSSLRFRSMAWWVDWRTTSCTRAAQARVDSSHCREVVRTPITA